MKYCSGKRPEFYCAVAALILAGCASTPDEAPAPGASNLQAFAQANCLYWYFEKAGYDSSDIRGISGGLVETGSAGPDTYAAISELVRSWSPDIQTKQALDVDLVKCFHLGENEALQALIADAGG